MGDARERYWGKVTSAERQAESARAWPISAPMSMGVLARAQLTCHAASGAETSPGRKQSCRSLGTGATLWGSHGIIRSATTCRDGSVGDGQGIGGQALNGSVEARVSFYAVGPGACN